MALAEGVPEPCAAVDGGHDAADDRGTGRGVDLRLLLAAADVLAIGGIVSHRGKGLELQRLGLIDRLCLRGRFA